MATYLLSILYLRCGMTREAAKQLVGITAFNSLFEMPPADKRNVRDICPPQLSILYLRCGEKRGGVAVYDVGYFQFSI